VELLTCWRCEQPGHGHAECDRPPAASRKELDARISRYVQRWQAGDITLSHKRTWIAAETRIFNGKVKVK
jgi:hypothetical protein